MSEMSSSHLPNVLSPLSVLNTVREHHVNTHVLKEPFNIEDQLSTQKNGERMLIIVQLPATVQTNFRKSMSNIGKCCLLLFILFVFSMIFLTSHDIRHLLVNAPQRLAYRSILVLQ